MPLLNFREEFAADVASLVKRQTIRRRRKHPVKQGEMLYLYTGLRTKRVRKLAEAYCLSVHDIVMENDAYYANVYVDNMKLGVIELYDLASADGFDSVFAFINFFYNRYGFPFEGQLIKW